MASLIDIASLVGIIVVVIVSFESLIHARRGAVRSSIEQLDAIRLGGRRDIKVKAILYRCLGVVICGHCEVKFKFYGVDGAGGSDPSVFVELPEAVFEGYETNVDPDGYIVSFDTNNPVEIRRKTNDIMLAMYESEKSRQSNTSE